MRNPNPQRARIRQHTEDETACCHALLHAVLRLLRPTVLWLAIDATSGLPVYLLADRGLWAAWLFATVRRYRWHPLLRVNP
ncbi:MAG: hypothetical protein N2554_07215 [Fimbriimonadales bacterium]|nr:hypothetical protein [Fimbriimonadales bacterium]